MADINHEIPTAVSSLSTTVSHATDTVSANPLASNSRKGNTKGKTGVNPHIQLFQELSEFLSSTPTGIVLTITFRSGYSKLVSLLNKLCIAIFAMEELCQLVDKTSSIECRVPEMSPHIHRINLLLKMRADDI